MAAVKPRAVLKIALSATAGLRLAWECKRMWRRTGSAAAIGAAALAAALFAQWHASGMREREPALHRQLAVAARTAAQPQAAVPDTAGGLAAFHAYLPAHTDIPEQLQTLVDIAAKHQVPLAKAEYKVQPEPRAGFMRYQINLPVKAGYASVQAFMLEALQTMPALTLDSAAFRRDHIDSSDTEARMQFVLLVRKAEGTR